MLCAGRNCPTSAEADVSEQVLTSTMLLVGYVPSGQRYELEHGHWRGDISVQVRSTVSHGLNSVLATVLFDDRAQTS